MNDSLLIEQIKVFKQKNTSYNVPETIGLVDDIFGKTSNRLILYFHYKEGNQVILTWVRRLDKERC
jgi:hypothetical protein